MPSGLAALPVAPISTPRCSTAERGTATTATGDRQTPSEADDNIRVMRVQLLRTEALRLVHYASSEGAERVAQDF